MKFGTWALGAVAALTLGSAPAKAFDWTGFYAAVMYGASFPQFDASFDVNFGMGGVAVAGGYNHDTGDWVFGVDKMLVYTPLFSADCEDVSGFYSCEGQFELSKLSFQVLGRVGYEVTDNAMVYVGAGAGWLWFFGQDTTSESFPYVAIAGGLEVAMSEHMYARLHTQASFPADFSEFWTFSVAGGIGLLL